MATPLASYTITAGVLQAYPSSSNPFISAGPATYGFLVHSGFNAMVASGAIVTAVNTIPPVGGLPAGIQLAASWSSQSSVAAYKALDSNNLYLMEVVNTFLTKQYATFDAATGIITFRNTATSVSGGGFSNQPLFLGAAKVTGINWDFKNSVIKGLIEATELTAPVPKSQLDKSVTELQTKIDAITSKDSDLQAQINVVKSDLATESSTRSSADSTLTTNLASEAIRATAAESSLENSISAEVLRASTKEDALQVSVDTINSTISPYPNLFSTELLAASAIKSQSSYSDLLLPDTIGDISYYPPNQIVILETVDINPTVDPETKNFVGWFVCGSGIPTGTTILNYRYDYTNYSSVGRAMYANLSNDIGEPSGTYTICVAMKVKSDIDFQNTFSCMNITDAVHPQEAAAFHQIDDAVSVEKIRAEAKETELNSKIADLQSQIDTETSARSSADIALGVRIDSEASARATMDTTLTGKINTEKADRIAADADLQAQIDTLKTLTDSLNVFSKALNKVMFHNDNLTPPV